MNRETWGCVLFSMCQKFSLLLPVLYITGVSGGDVWRAAQTGGRRTHVLLAGSQHRCSVGRAEALKVCLRCVGIFDWEDWQKKRLQWVLLDTTTWLGIFLELWMLTVQTCCLEPVLNIHAQACAEAFWKPLESHSITSWCLGRRIHCPVLAMIGQKYKLSWNAVKRS